VIAASKTSVWFSGGGITMLDIILIIYGIKPSIFIRGV
jgi:hypothetical protein